MRPDSQPFPLVAGLVCVTLGFVLPTSLQAAAPVDLVYATPVTQSDVWKAGEGTVIQRFMEENPHIKVTARQIPFESYDTQVLLSIRGGSGPDVARVNHSTIRMWAGAGYLAELDDFIARSRVIAPNDYWPGFWGFCRYNGRQFSLPLGTDCRVLYYNVSLFKAARLPGPPRTWQELAEYAHRIQQADRKVFGFASPSSNEWSTAYDMIGNFLVANGGHMLDAEGTRGTTGSDPRAAEAFKFVCDLVTRYDACPPGMANMTGEVIESLFVGNRLGMTIGGPYVRDNLKRLDAGFAWKDKYDTALVPAGPATGTSGSAQGGWMISAFAGSRHPAEALALLEFFQRPESLATVAAVENLPPRRAAMSFGPFKDPFYAVFFEQLQTARPPLTVVPQLPNVARAIQRAYQRVVAGGATADEAIAWLDARITNHVLK